MMDNCYKNFPAIKHFAYNLTTGELIGSARVCHLNRSVKWHQHYDRKYGEPKGVWVFAHGPRANEKLRTKLLRMGAIKG